MQKSYSPIGCLPCLLVCVLLSGHTARAETLAEALELAYASNPSLSAEQARTRAADESVTQAKAAYGPSIDANADYTYRREVNDNALVDSNEGASGGYAVTLSQPLLSFGRLEAGVGIANADRLAAREQLRLIEQSVTAETILAYVRVRRDLAIYSVRLQIAALFNEQNEITRKRFDLRAATLTDVEQINNQTQIAKALAREALATLEASANQYRRVVGQFPGELASLPPSPPLPPLESLLSSADQLSPQIRIAAYSENGARQLVALRRAERMPVVSAELGAANAPMVPFTNDDRQLRSFVGVSVTMPIFRGGQLGSRIREANELVQAARFDREEVRRTVRNNASSNWSQAQAAARVAPVYAAAVASGKAALLNARRQETAGLRTSREVIDITNDLLQARINAINAAANGYTASALALFEAGLLDPSLFGANVARYDPDAYDPFVNGFAGLPLRPIIGPVDSLFVESQTKDLAVYYEASDHWEAPKPRIEVRIEELLRSDETDYANQFPAPRFDSGPADTTNKANPTKQTAQPGG